MFREFIEPTQLEEVFLNETPLIDVRAPVEFAQGSLPGSKNFNILNDEERALVGTEYKINGPDAAVVLGHKLVSGENKEQKILAWKTFANQNPQALIYCFRGGQRSQISQTWLRDSGMMIPRLRGGYKLARQFLIERSLNFTDERMILPLAGPTGSGKTILIRELDGRYPSIDLENLAQHRGSAFGATEVAQPSQVDFENLLALEMIKLEKKFDLNLKVLVEDESRLVGKCVVPAGLFEKVYSSPAILIEEDLGSRVENIFGDYIIGSAISKDDETKALKTFLKYKNSLLAISKKLGGDRTKEVMGLLAQSERDYVERRALDSNRLWIEKLLVYYYDPLYLSSLKRRDVKFVFQGSRRDCLQYLIS